MNTSLSKSEAKGLGCEYYYHKYYVEKHPQHVMSWTKVGTEFHNFMEDYVRYLVGQGLRADLAWAKDRADSVAICDEARDLVLRYVAKFELRDPAAVLGIESFLVIDKDWVAIDDVAYPGVGKRPEIHGAFAHGTIDRIEQTTEDGIEITDYKTGFLPSRVDEYEAQHYALLAFCHYPRVRHVTFTWDFVRFGSRDSVRFERDELPELMSAMRRKLAQRAEVVAAAKPACNSMAGLCGYCALPCAARENALKGGTIYRPLQDNADAVKAAQTLASIRSCKSTLEAQLKAYLAKTGTVNLGSGNAAYLETKFSPRIPARTALAVMGVEVPEVSPQFDVALDSLTINTTDFKRIAGARKRAGLLDSVLASSPTTPRTDLAIGRMPTE